MTYDLPPRVPRDPRRQIIEWLIRGGLYVLKARKELLEIIDRPGGIRAARRIYDLVENGWNALLEDGGWFLADGNTMVQWEMSQVENNAAFSLAWIVVADWLRDP